MKILVTGYSGQLGYDVVQSGRQLGWEMIGTTREDLDITNERQVANFLLKAKPDAIIHCAAYTAVDKAEEDRMTCYQVNVEGTGYLAKAAQLIKAKFMYISTDYVFDGGGNRPFREMDIPSPVGYYGWTKFWGEQKAAEILEQLFIVRISWVFGLNGNNFVKSMLKLAETRNELRVVGDQYGSPTYSLDAARLLLEMIQTNKFGIYHVSNEGYCSWADFAIEIFKQSNKDIQVISIPTEEYPTRAMRPKNSRLSKQKLADEGFISLPSWEEAVGDFLRKLNFGG